MTEAEQVPERRRQVGKLSHPAVKYQLIRDLALSGSTQRALAEKYDCAVSSINEFQGRNAAAINAVRDDAANEFAGIWIAEKTKRVMAYKEQVDYLNDRIEELGVEDAMAAFKVAQAALKGAAEEMGQLTARVAVQADVNAKVQYEVKGVDTEALT